MNGVKSKLLLIEDDLLISNYLLEKIAMHLSCDVELLMSYHATQKRLKEEAERFFLAIVDLSLLDRSDTDIVALVSSYHIPIVVYTAKSKAFDRQQLLQFNIVDYVRKDSSWSLGYIVQLVEFFHTNRHRSILIVDDSSTARNQMEMILKRFQMRIFVATHPLEALQILSDQPDITLMVTDYNMPGMNGDVMIREIRDHGYDDLVIIGVSSNKEDQTTIDMLKSGANDFLYKPVKQEELVMRIIKNIQMSDLVKKAINSASVDFLTGLGNRRYFDEVAPKAFNQAKRSGQPLTLAMIDVDHFKKVNDRYGHTAGDLALKSVADVLSESIRESDILARYGGEEFILVLHGTDGEAALNFLEKLRQKILQRKTVYGNITFGVTVSIGMSTDHNKSFERMIDDADRALYRAKESGRNQIIVLD